MAMAMMMMMEVRLQGPEKKLFPKTSVFHSPCNYASKILVVICSDCKLSSCFGLL